MGERADPLSNTRTADDAGSASQSDPAAIEQEIEATREEISETIEAIQSRLAPEQLAKQAKETVREVAGQATTAAREATAGTAHQVATQTRETAERVRGGLWSAIRQNPIPAALIVIGMSWLWRQQSRNAGGGRPADGSQQQGLGQMVETNPLAAGALGLVLGGVVGLVIPETEREHRLMGGTRDRAIGRAQERILGDIQAHVQEVAEQAVETVVEKAQDVMPTSGSPSRTST